jgi:hypothetical protein
MYLLSHGLGTFASRAASEGHTGTIAPHQRSLREPVCFVEVSMTFDFRSTVQKLIIILLYMYGTSIRHL